jgi:hypothetical protein
MLDKPVEGRLVPCWLDIVMPCCCLPQPTDYLLRPILPAQSCLVPDPLVSWCLIAVLAPKQLAVVSTLPGPIRRIVLCLQLYPKRPGHDDTTSDRPFDRQVGRRDTKDTTSVSGQTSLLLASCRLTEKFRGNVLYISAFKRQPIRKDTTPR